MSGELTAANAKIQRKAAEEPNSGFRFVSNTDLASFFSVIFAQTRIMMTPNILICQNFVDAEMWFQSRLSQLGSSLELLFVSEVVVSASSSNFQHAALAAV